MAIITKDTKEGEAFAGKPKRVRWERIWAFSGGPFRLSGWPSKNIHTDLEFAKSCGLPSVAASGSQSTGHLAQLMIGLFGVEWLSNGTMDAKFIGIVDAGDTLVSKAIVHSKEVEKGAAKFTLDIYCENQRGQKVVVGSASGITGGVGPSRGAEGWHNRRAELMADSSIDHDVSGEPQLEPLEYVVTPELNQQYCYAEEDFHPRYIEETEAGPPIAHPGLIINWSNATRSPSYRVGPGEGGVATGHEYFFCNPARVGKKLRVTWKTIGSYEKRGRLYSVGNNVVVDEDGLDILRRFSHSTVVTREHAIKG